MYTSMYTYMCAKVPACHYVHARTLAELHCDDGLDDVDDDVMQEEAVVGHQEGHKDDQVGVDAWVHQDLHAMYNYIHVHDCIFYTIIMSKLERITHVHVHV